MLATTPKFSIYIMNAMTSQCHLENVFLVFCYMSCQRSSGHTPIQSFEPLTNGFQNVAGNRYTHRADLRYDPGKENAWY